MNDTRTAGLSPRSVTYLRAILRRALRDAVKWGLVTRNAAALTDPPRATQKPVQPLSPAEVQQLIEAVKDDWYGPLFVVAVTTGLRQGELFGLRWQDLDLTNGVLRVRHAMQRVGGKATLVEPKTARSRRTLSLPGITVEAIKTQKVRQKERRLFLGADWQEQGLVFTSSVGTPCNPSNVTHRLQRILEEVGLPRQRFHDLRHCAASLLLAAGENPRVVMEVLGHSQIGLTMNTYSHVMPAALEQAAGRIDALLKGGKAR